MPKESHVSIWQLIKISKDLFFKRLSYTPSSPLSNLTDFSSHTQLSLASYHSLSTLLKTFSFSHTENSSHTLTTHSQKLAQFLTLLWLQTSRNPLFSLLTKINKIVTITTSIHRAKPPSNLRPQPNLPSSATRRNPQTRIHHKPLSTTPTTWTHPPKTLAPWFSCFSLKILLAESKIVIKLRQISPL